MHTRGWHLALLSLLLTACGGSALPGLDLEADVDPAQGLRDDWCGAPDRAIHVVSSGDPEALALLFIHGTPGGWGAFKDYLTDPDLRTELHLVSIDRLGWGASGADRPVQAAFSAHSTALEPVLEALAAANGGTGVIVVGHSLGASLAPRLAADHPEEVRAMMLLAGSHDPQLRARRWYNLIADLPPLEWLIARDLKRSNDEIMALPRELTLNAGLWPDIRMPLVLIQGMDDPLVSPGHADYVETIATGADVRILRLKDTDHFIPWNRFDLIKAELLNLSARVRKTAPRRPVGPVAASTCAFDAATR